MPKFSARLMLLFLLSAAFFLLACETSALVQGVLSAPTRTAANTPQGAAPSRNPTRPPNAPFDFTPIGAPRCVAGNDSVSVVKGSLVNAGAPVVGQRVQASSRPGGEAFGNAPVISDDNGDFELRFVCQGSACNGSYWLWVINEQDEQVSPLIEFIFDNQCRRGTVNFSAR